MEQQKSVKQNVNFTVNKPLTPPEINSRIELLSQKALAEDWGVSQSYVCLLIQGQRLFSPLVKKLARKLRTTEQDLRGVLSDRAHLLTEEKQQNVA